MKPILHLLGDRYKARQFIWFAEKKLAELKKVMGLTNTKFGSRFYSTPNDDVTVYVESYLGFDKIRIIAKEKVGIIEDIFVFGGLHSSNKREDFVGVYSISNNSWKTKTSLSQPRGFATAENVDDKIYIMGGRGALPADTKLNLNEEYDPATDTYTAKAVIPDHPDALPNQGRAAHGSAVVNNKIYIFGGAGIRDNVDVMIVHEYDPSLDSWDTKANVPSPRQRFGTAVVNNKVYIIGGFETEANTFVGTNEEYDPATDSWSTKAIMPTVREEIITVSVNNKIYAVGGNTPTQQTIVEEYNPSTNTWDTVKTSMPTARGNMGAVAKNNKIYVIGGFFLTNSLNNVEVYDPTLDSWRTLFVYPKPLRDIAVSI